MEGYVDTTNNETYVKYVYISITGDLGKIQNEKMQVLGENPIG